MVKSTESTSGVLLNIQIGIVKWGWSACVRFFFLFSMFAVRVVLYLLVNFKVQKLHCTTCKLHKLNLGFIS